MKFTLWLVIVLFSATAECAEPGFVGDITGNDRILHVHLYNLLLSRGIEAGFSGSIVHDVVVPPSQAEAARRLIREDAPKRRYDIWFAEGDQIRAYRAPTERLSRRMFFGSLLHRASYSRRTAIGRLLRRKEIAALVAKYPYIDSLEVGQRRYFATPTKLRTAYQVDIHLNSILGPGGAGYGLATYYVDDHGQDITP